MICRCSTATWKPWNSRQIGIHCIWSWNVVVLRRIGSRKKKKKKNRRRARSESDLMISAVGFKHDFFWFWSIRHFISPRTLAPDRLRKASKGINWQGSHHECFIHERFQFDTTEPDAIYDQPTRQLFRRFYIRNLYFIWVSKLITDDRKLTCQNGPLQFKVGDHFLAWLEQVIRSCSASHLLKPTHV